LSSTPQKTLTLFDSTCLVVGIIVGAGIFETAPAVAKAAGSVGGMFALWVVGGLVSLAGALCYAELATAYPREGGDYVYLTRAYGRWAGFLFGWIQLVIVRPGDVALMAFVFARHAMPLFLPGADVKHGAGLAAMLSLACGAVVVLTAINIVGVRQGKWTQNVLTVVKIGGIVAVLAIAACARPGAADVPAPTIADSPGTLLGTVLVLAVALIRVLFTYGGWNEMAYVAAEVKRPDRDILRALVLGTVSVTVIYLAVNAAFVHTLGLDGLARSEAIGRDLGDALMPRVGGRLVAALICISALGALNGLIFAGSRISYALGSEHRLFARLGRWNPTTGTPIAALVVQGMLAVAIMVGFGSFDRTILYTAAAVYSFYAATSLAVIVLRRREPKVARPYRVTGYPLVPLFFAASCGALIYGALTYKPIEAGISAVIVLVGLLVYWVSKYVGGKGLGTGD